HAGLTYSWSAILPLVVQAFLVVGAWYVLGRIRWQPRATDLRPRRVARFLAALIASQLVLFMLLEVTERIAQRDPFAEGLFGSSFLFELTSSVGSALFLIALGSAVLRLVRWIWRQQPVVVAQIRTPSRPVVI